MEIADVKSMARRFRWDKVKIRPGCTAVLEQAEQARAGGKRCIKIEDYHGRGVDVGKGISRGSSTYRGRQCKSGFD